MGTVTQYNLANVQSALGGANPISMSEYYRGGAYVPTTRSTTVTEGPAYSINNYDFVYYTFLGTGTSLAYWNASSQGGYPSQSVSGEVGSMTGGAFTYIRGSYVGRTGSSFSGYRYHYYITRQYQSSTTINTGVPSSGAISISQLYGAANP